MLKGKRFKQFAIFAVVGGYVWIAYAALHPVLPSLKKPLVFYSTQLHDDLKLVYIRAIQEAKSSIFLQIYGLTDPKLITVLCDKKKQGLPVTIVYDKTASKNLPKELEATAAKCKGLMHRKILIIDDEKVFLGTANFTTQSLKMHDNLLLGAYSPKLANFLKQGTGNACIPIGTTSILPFYLPDREKNACQALLDCIANAKETIRIAMFTLTHKELVTKLSEAQKRGVGVFVGVDRYTAQGASRRAIEELKKNGVEIYLSQGSQLLHHKWALFDKKILVMGSANWTCAAFEKNEDCILLLENLGLKEQKMFDRLWRAIAIASEKG